jgi:hypothetical protein|tara:strand:+ start:28 stop:645 length:618 start_codon:yes stop_codon:yes gene_type:complete
LEKAGVIKGKSYKLGENTYGIKLEDYATKEDYHYALLKAHKKRHAENYKKKHGHKSRSGDVRYKKNLETGEYVYKFKKDPETFVYKQRNKLRETEKGRYELKLQSIERFWGKHVVEWYEKQKPNCRICEKKLKMSSILKSSIVKDYSEEAVIDHDYKLGTQRDIKKSKSILPRGILCHTCNQGIGLLKENKMILKNAIKYVEGLI